MRLQSFPSGGAAGCIAVVLLPWKGWEAGGAGGFRVVGLRFAIVVGTPVSKGGTVEGEGGAVGLVGLFLVVGLRVAAVDGTPVPWKGVGGAGWFLVVGLRFAAVDGTPG